MAVETAATDLVLYALSCGLIEETDLNWAYNRVLECIGAPGPLEVFSELDGPSADFEQPLYELVEAGVANGMVEDTLGGRDRLAMRIMGVLTPRPSEVASIFWALYEEEGPKAATDYLYQLSCDVDYVRVSAIAKNLGWNAETPWGALEITINKSKPEKDPRDIAAAGKAAVGEKYPACQLCVQNEGYAGRGAAHAMGEHPARQNLRIVPIQLNDERWGLQYSPYAYFTEHCIAMSVEHRPMHIDRSAFTCLLDFVDLFNMAGFPHIEGFVVKWPLSVLQLESTDREELLEAACHVLDAWRAWSDESVGVYAFTGETPHNTITPICRKLGDRYVMALALRCNITSDENPLGVFHPHADKWHVKKENIGLIEVMGMAILPPRLEAEMEAGRLSQEEIGRVFGAVLEDAGVFKWDDAGRAAQMRFVGSL